MNVYFVKWILQYDKAGNFLQLWSLNFQRLVIEVTLIQNALNRTTSFYQYLLYICLINIIGIVHCCYIAKKASRFKFSDIELRLSCLKVCKELYTRTIQLEPKGLRLVKFKTSTQRLSQEQHIKMLIDYASVFFFFLQRSFLSIFLWQFIFILL